MVHPVRFPASPLRVGEPSRLAARPAAQPAARSAFMDQATFSNESLAMGRLLRMWGTLSQLFGQKPATQGPDLEGLRQALFQAQKNLAEVRTRTDIMDTLKSSALRQAEILVDKYYGLKGDGAPLKVKFEDEMGSALAAVSYQYDRQGRTVNQTLHLNMSQFTPDTGPNGTNSHIIENDRIIAHEVTHAVMGRNMNWRALPEWFKEGTAEYIAGGAERVGLALQTMSAQSLVERVAYEWTGDSSQYAGAYLAVRYMDKLTAEGGGLKAVMARLKEGETLDAAINEVSGGALADSRDFLRHWLREGAAFIRTLDLSGRDAGSIKSGTSGPNVVPDQGYRSSQPMQGFRIIWPSPVEGVPLFGQAAAVADAYRQHMIR